MSLSVGNIASLSVGHKLSNSRKSGHMKRKFDLLSNGWQAFQTTNFQ